MKRLRTLDTGVLEGRLNIAIGQAIIEAHQAGEIPDTLRFLRFCPVSFHKQARLKQANKPRPSKTIRMSGWPASVCHRR